MRLRWRGGVRARARKGATRGGWRRRQQGRAPKTTRPTRCAGGGPVQWEQVRGREGLTRQVTLEEGDGRGGCRRSEGAGATSV
eukprot:1097902-Pleurochrysis_carterae.AAC.1